MCVLVGWGGGLTVLTQTVTRRGKSRRKASRGQTREGKPLCTAAVNRLSHSGGGGEWGGGSILSGRRPSLNTQPNFFPHEWREKKRGQQNKSDRSVKCAAGTGPAPRTEPFPRGKLSVPLLVPPVLFIGGRSHISRLHSRGLLAQKVISSNWKTTQNTRPPLN